MKKIFEQRLPPKSGLAVTGLAIAVAVGSFYLLGDGIRDLLDPNLRA
jgi:ABC-type dipeptide/oligopeptide/nickel transport system permease subunit